MGVTDLIRIIYNNYPKVYKKINASIARSLNAQYYIIQCYKDQIMVENTYFSDDGLCFELPFSMLYALLEDFFEENGIIIDVFYSNYYGNNIDIVFDFIIFDTGKNRITHAINAPFNDKTEAKMQAILKACEIFNNQLEKKESKDDFLKFNADGFTGSYDPY